MNLDLPITKKEIVYLILPFFFLLLLFPTVLTPNQLLITGSSDTTLLINGELSVMKNPVSLWNNNWLTGLPEYASPLSDRFYPFFYPFLILTQDPFIINIIVLVHIYIAYLCFFKLAGLMTKSPELRMIASLLFVFSGTLLSRVYIGHVLILIALSWIPLLYYAFFKIVWENEATVKNVCLLAFSLLLIFSTGAIYYLFYSCAILLVFFVYYFLKKQVTNGVIYAVAGGFVLMGLISAIKFIPIALISNSLERIDSMNGLGNPLGGGGSLESVFSTIVFGTPIDKVFGFWECSIFIGMFVLILVILGLLFDRKTRTIPAFFAIVFAFIWAESGQSLFFFIHLLPVLSNFRCSGRMFGALTPILILFAISGFETLKKYMQSGEPIILNPDQKRMLGYGVVVLILIKLLELPFQTAVSLESYLASAFIIIFIGLLYFNKLTIENIFYVLIAAILVNLAIIFGYNVAPVTLESGFKVVGILAVLVAVIAYFNRDCFIKPSIKKTAVWVFLLAGLGVLLLGNTCYLQTTDLKLNSSQAVPIVDRMLSENTDGHQLWVLETGWAYQHLDFTYWFLKNGIHPVHSYYGYYMKTSITPLFNIGNTTYFTSDYIVDNKYLENGQQNLPEVTYVINNISIYKPANVLPNAFVIHGDTLVPAKIEKFTSDEIILTGQFSNGDIAGIKTAFYPGWKANGVDMKNIGNMPISKIDANTTSITFRYDPLDFKVGLFFTVVGLFALFIVFIKRREINAYLLAVSPVIPVEEESVTKKKSKKRRR